MSVRPCKSINASQLGMLLALSLPLAGCAMQRDDTTQVVRRTVANAMSVSYEEARPDATLEDLDCGDFGLVTIVVLIEEHYGITIPPDELDKLKEQRGDWRQITVLDLANLTRAARTAEKGEPTQ